MISLRNKVVQSWKAAAENFEQIAKVLDPGTTTGHGDPNGVVRADLGALYRNLDGGAGVTLWVKEANAGLATGWVAK